MTKLIVLQSAEEAEDYVQRIHTAANNTAMNINEQSGYGTGIELLEKMKFGKLGVDPLDSERELNLIEQLNQTYTYLASFKAAEHLFGWHLGLAKLTLNLGTSSGSDLESKEFGGIAAEVFAATKPNSNDKLRKDIKKVQGTEAQHKYVFFNCPFIEAGKYAVRSQEG